MIDFARSPARLRALLIVLLALMATSAHAEFQVLTAGKVARFKYRGNAEREGGVIVVSRDRALDPLLDPRCPATSRVQIKAYLQTTQRVAELADIALDCANWSPAKDGYRYRDPGGTVKAIRYDSKVLRLKIQGPDFDPALAEVAFFQAGLSIGATELRARFHSFARNTPFQIASRRPTKQAAAGEAGFWDMLLGDVRSEAQQQALILELQEAAKRNRRDGRSRFLLGMTHLYRFGQRVARPEEADSEARAELAAANAALAEAVPLLWDAEASLGDSRVLGFAASARYMQAFVDGDAAAQTEALAALDHAVQANPFFNVFNYITVLQALPPSDPIFQQAFDAVVAYLNEPETFACLSTQPDLCANTGFAPHNMQGSLTLFGDLYAKAGNLSQAEFWYSLAALFPETATWEFLPALEDRIANAAARVALYADEDPSNDPPIIGAGAEACLSCHVR